VPTKPSTAKAASILAPFRARALPVPGATALRKNARHAHWKPVDTQRDILTPEGVSYRSP